MQKMAQFSEFQSLSALLLSESGENPADCFFEICKLLLILSGLGGGEGGSARTDFTFETFSDTYKQYLLNMAILLKFIGEQDSGKLCIKGITYWHANPIFDAMFSQI